MALRGTSHASATNKPKHLTDAEKIDCYADNTGWTVAAGGNGNPNAQRETLVAIGDLAGTSATTGLREATATSFRFIVGTTDNTDLTANDANAEVQVEIGTGTKYVSEKKIARKKTRMDKSMTEKKPKMKTRQQVKRSRKKGRKIESLNEKQLADRGQTL